MFSMQHCILYECLVGKRPFEGETITETLAAILRGEPNWQALPETISPAIRRLLLRCLKKDTSSRFHSAADVRIEIEEARRRNADWAGHIVPPKKCVFDY
jgi:serine/threonine-protein kinase